MITLKQTSSWSLRRCAANYRKGLGEVFSSYLRKSSRLQVKAVRRFASCQVLPLQQWLGRGLLKLPVLGESRRRKAHRRYGFYAPCCPNVIAPELHMASCIAAYRCKNHMSVACSAVCFEGPTKSTAVLLPNSPQTSADPFTRLYLLPVQPTTHTTE